MDQENLNQDTVKTKLVHSDRTLKVVIFLFLTIVVFLAGWMLGKLGYLTKTNNQRPLQAVTPVVGPSTPTEQEIINRIMSSSAIFPSFDNLYYFWAVPNFLNNRCFYFLTDSKGHIYSDFKTILGQDSVNCSFGEGSLSSSFVGWADNDQFVVEMTPGNVKIVDAKNKKIQEHNYDPKQLKIVVMDRTLNFWLFYNHDNSGKQTSYSLLDQDNKVLLNNLMPPDKDAGIGSALYDRVNNGLVFLTTVPSGARPSQTISTKIYFLSFNNLILRNILTTDPVPAPGGHGCIPESLVSQPGEVIIVPGCFIYPTKYLAADKNVHIKL